MSQRDILLFFSDQHAPQFMAGEEINVDTPHLNALRTGGTTFTQAYTACPLCVPARMAMLSGLRASHTGIFTNVDTLSDTMPTFLHHLAAAGYETVLIGRMHFIGENQRHGFTKRIAPDITLVTWTRPEHLKQERGVFARTFAGKWAPQVVGGGESPVLHYDELVIQAAEDYLRQPHQKPQFIIVGTYGPHFPYVAPKKLFQKYWERVEVPAMHNTLPPYMNRCLQKHRVETTPQVAKGVRAAYCGMIEHMDGQIGRVKAAFDNFTARRGTQKLFGYFSDHGDQAGERDLYGKETFFEKSVRIPLILAGDDVVQNQRIDAPVSILDIAPTMCEWAGASALNQADGISLAAALKGQAENNQRMVYSEYMEKLDDAWHYSIMLRHKGWKFISYHGFEESDMLFDLEKDPLEKQNRALESPETLKAFRIKAQELAPFPQQYEQAQEQQTKDAQLFIAYENAVGLKEQERWKDNPPSARVNPEICIAGL
ncbi:MAG: sulfatase-like hydrolase/transferase [Oscillospiraceae bacterium]|nr:sulfatase-like hydrolase/transferase [Oscillospiraceae bacterium]